MSLITITQKTTNSKYLFILSKYLSLGILTLVLIQHPLASQNNMIEEVGIDSTLKWVKQHIKEKPDEGKLLINNIIAVSEKKKDFKQLGEAHAILADFYSSGLYKNDSGYYHFDKAILNFKELGDNKRVASMYQTLSFTNSYNSKHEEALKNMFKALAIYENEKDEVSIGVCYSIMCEIYHPLENYEKAIEYGEKSLVLLKKNNENKEVVFTERALSAAYRSNKDYEKAMLSINNAIAYIKENKNQFNNSVLPDAYNRRGLIYKYTKEYDLALTDYFEALRIIKEEPKYNAFNVSAYQINIAHIYELQEKYKEALPFLENSLEYILKSGERYNAKSLYEGLASNHYKLGNYKKAYDNQQQLLSIQDSFHSDKIKSLESELAIKYESNKKDETIATQETTIFQQKQAQWLSLGFLSLLATLLASLFFSSRKNKKNSALLQAQNNQIEERSKQNELLLKEIHHRVKNNLQTVSSLLALQSNRIQDSVALDAIQGSRNRVQSMSMIHQKLYQGKNLASIEMKDYFIDLSDGILHTFGMGEQIDINCDMKDLEIDVDIAVPIGLIVNELLTNSLKYAFPGSEKGSINITLEKTDTHYALHYTDNGIGKDPASKNPKTGFGSQLIKLLSKQLQATIEEVVDNGTKILIQFPT